MAMEWRRSLQSGSGGLIIDACLFLGQQTVPYNPFHCCWLPQEAWR
jgi:hypothetical protein